MEGLEERCVPAAFLVNNAGDAGSGSGLSGDLRYCISQANSTSEDDTITFADIGPQQRTGAATLSGMAQQMAMTLAVTFAALLLNGLVALRGGHSAGLTDFQRAFLLIGLAGVLSVIPLLRLSKDAGAELAGHA